MDNTPQKTPPDEMTVRLTQKASADLMDAIFGLHAEQGASIDLLLGPARNGVMKADIEINFNSTAHAVELRGDGTWFIRSLIRNPNVEE